MRHLIQKGCGYTEQSHLRSMRKTRRKCGMVSGLVFTTLKNAHLVPTGEPERERAEKYKQKAEEVENAGYHRFAVTLRKLADGYEREAEIYDAEHEAEMRMLQNQKLIERESARRLANLGGSEPQLQSVPRRRSDPA